MPTFPLDALVDLMDRMVIDGVTIGRYWFHPPETRAFLGSTQLAVISHAGAPFDLEWQDLDEQTSVRHRVETGQFHILPPMTPVQLHWTGTQTAAVITFSPAFLAKVAEEFLEGVIPRIAPQVALPDTIVRYLTSTLHDKIGRREHHITRCAERISATLACHLLASFGETQVPPIQVKGGLGTAQQRRVLAFIEAHVPEGHFQHPLVQVVFGRDDGDDASIVVDPHAIEESTDQHSEKGGAARELGGSLGIEAVHGLTVTSHLGRRRALRDSPVRTPENQGCPCKSTPIRIPKPPSAQNNAG